LDGGIENALQVVKLGETRDRFHVGIALILIRDGRGDGGGDIRDQLHEGVEVPDFQHSLVADDLNHGDKLFLVQDGNVGQGVEGTPDVKVGVLFTPEAGAGEDHPLLFAHDHTESAGLRIDGALLHGDLAGDRFGHPAHLGLEIAAGVEDNGGAGKEFRKRTNGHAGAGNDLALLQ
jgi:hypothetical protein